MPEVISRRSSQVLIVQGLDPLDRRVGVHRCHDPRSGDHTVNVNIPRYSRVLAHAHQSEFRQAPYPRLLADWCSFAAPGSLPSGAVADEFYKTVSASYATAPL